MVDEYSPAGNRVERSSALPQPRQSAVSRLAQHMRTAGGWYVPLVLLFLTAATLIRWIDPFFVHALRLIAFDSYQRLAPQPYDPELPVRIVIIDEESLARIGQWPWPRSTLAELLHGLHGNGASVVAFDIVFAEPDRTSIEEIAKRLPPRRAAVLLEEMAGEPSNDQLFAAALAESPTVLAAALGSAGASKIVSKAGFAIAGDDPRPFIPAFATAGRNLEILDAAASGIGAINWLPDRDQIVRRAHLVFRVGQSLVPSLGAEVLRVAQGASTYVLKGANASGETAFGKNTGLNHVRIGDLEIPTDADGAVILNFRPSNPAAFIPAWKVLAGEVGSDEVAGRIVLVGASAPGLSDIRSTPLDAEIPGVEIQAELLEHVLAGRTLTRPDYARALEASLVAVLGLLLAAVLPRIAARWAAVVGAGAIVLWLLGGWIAFRRLGVLLDPSYPALALGAITAGITLHVYHRVETQRGAIRSAFGRYLAPAVIEELIADPEKLKLGGEVRELTLMFCDIRNFTTISERLDAMQLTSLLNEVLTPLSEVILSHRGTIDKYMGDAVMAFWNAPLDDPDHGDDACAAALEMTKRLAALNDRWRQQAAVAQRPFHEVQIGIGINTGECCVGNFGTTYRFDYSALGDEVNVTSRLERLTKTYGVPTVLGEQALAKTSRAFPALELDLVTVKGRARPSRVYTLLELLGNDSSDLASLSMLQPQLLAAYRSRQWDEAERLLAECRALGVARLDRYYALFAARIASARKIAPQADWDGSHTMEDK